MRRVGLLLAGCGIYDGSEVQETVLLLRALEERGFRVAALAPDVEQADVVDHTTALADSAAPARRVLAEAARLTRGVIRSLAEFDAGEVDALMIPGGMGAVKNLCLPGNGPLGGGEPRPEVARLLRALLERGAPVAAVGLGGVVLARFHGIPLDPAAVTVPATEIRLDEERGILFTPGFMGSPRLAEVARGLERLVDEIEARLTPSPRNPSSRGTGPA